MATVLILGGGYLQSDFIKQSLANGYKTYVIDRDKSCYCSNFIKEANFKSIDFYDYQAVEKYVEQIEPDVIIAPVNEIGNEIASRIAEKYKMKYNSVDTVKLSTNKSYLTQRLKDSFINIPSTVSIDHQHYDWPEEIQFPVIVKPAGSSSSKGVSLISDRSEIKNAVDYSLRFVDEYKQILVQEYIEGDQLSIETVTFNNHHLIVGITVEEISNAPYFFERNDLMGPKIYNRYKRICQDFVNELLNCTNVTVGACHIEVKIVGDKIYLIDFATRSGGWRDLLISSTGGYNYNDLILKSYLGEEIGINDFQPPFYAMACVLMYPDDMKQYTKARNDNVLKGSYFYAREPVKNPKTLADAYGYFFVQTNNEEELKKYKLINE